ncbi:PRSS12 [Mytilus coruscus]|uniref:PRSS12 n=1 Tax=Mytilus coruscus TaxID=42192 RepID=A0A6J7ZVC3_MYTCO|nr:PRSS12 [Mytilus coruscus]
MWGTVCKDYFDDTDATVACRQLGYNSGKFAGAIGNGTGRIWLVNLGCSGNELTLGDCSSAGWSNENCVHNDDVGIECLNMNEGDLRINLKRLEIFHNNEWGGVCREEFNHTDAMVACRQLGYRECLDKKGSVMETKVTSLKANHVTRSGYVGGYDSYGGKKIWLAEVYCKGGERNLASCEHAEWGKKDCKYIVEIACHNEILGGYECSTKWACEYLVQIAAGVAAGSILTTVVFVLVCQYVASRMRTQNKDQPYSNTLNTDKPTGAYDGVVAFQNVSNDAKSEEEIYDIVE